MYGMIAIKSNSYQLEMRYNVLNLSESQHKNYQQNLILYKLGIFSHKRCSKG